MEALNHSIKGALTPINSTIPTAPIIPTILVSPPAESSPSSQSFTPEISISGWSSLHTRSSSPTSSSSATTFVTLRKSTSTPGDTIEATSTTEDDTKASTTATSTSRSPPASASTSPSAVAVPAATTQPPWLKWSTQANQTLPKSEEELKVEAEIIQKKWNYDNLMNLPYPYIYPWVQVYREGIATTCTIL